jgi:hypothetical protein
VRAVAVQARARARRVLLQTWHGALGAGLAGMPCRWCCWICSACCSRRSAQRTYAPAPHSPARPWVADTAQGRRRRVMGYAFAG